MGVFDTIILEPPIECPGCGKPFELQTKHFDPAMTTYRIGSIVSGIFEDELWCRTCFEAKRESRKKVYLVLWHSILAGVELSEDAAERRLVSVDRVDLIEWLDRAQRGERDWRRRFRAFHLREETSNRRIRSRPS